MVNLRDYALDSCSNLCAPFAAPDCCGVPLSKPLLGGVSHSGIVSASGHPHPPQAPVLWPDYLGRSRCPTAPNLHVLAGLAIVYATVTPRRAIKARWFARGIRQPI
jgi:hypothetical protein